MNTIANQSIHAYNVSNTIKAGNASNKSIEYNQIKDTQTLKSSVQMDISAEGKNLLQAKSATYQRPVRNTDDINGSKKVAASSGTTETTEEKAEIPKATLNNTKSSSLSNAMASTIGSNFDVSL